ncbi:zinc finger C2HC domain-containing protein 1C-like isoform X2 [Aricia agestis]|uniref:zinc finger C2HC domain-containing protein 1C-like isoform X2 n=1 Tax=Aricia agestis TaxID=91739 RepID=UPI001C20A0F8|nr:zinc finger C2HC domain-containing protein 1C-like isoform X2 [Aricia agestis]
MEKTGGSRLLQMQATMQARFHQKQFQEREQKIASLYEAQQARALDRVRQSPGSVSVSPPALAAVATAPSAPLVAHQPGKVRQMFEDRRTKAGIDKSYPLQPIHNTAERTQKKELSNGYSNERIQQKKELSNGYSNTERIQLKKELSNGFSNTERIQQKKELSNGYGTERMHQKKELSNGYINTERMQQRKELSNGYSSTVTRTAERKVSKTNSVTSNVVKKHSVRQTKVGRVDNIVNGSGDVNHNHMPDIKSIKKTSQSNGELNNSERAQLAIDETDKVENNYLIEDETFPEALAPAPTPRDDSAEKRQPEPKQPEPKQLQAKQPEASPQRKSPPPRQSKSPVKVKPPVPSAPSPRPRTVAEKKYLIFQSGSSLGAARRGGSADGEGCAVCGRRFAPDRLAKHQEICKKTSTKKRKPFDVLKHRLAGTEAEPFIPKLRKSTAASAAKTQAPANSSWRQKHEEFIQAIRAAKQVQAHLNAGGKLSDLPPPPPSQNPDYVQCPHCSRRFNQGAAERHIPKCANFQFNKPKKPPTKRR